MKLQSIQVLRGLAVAAVLIAHSGGALVGSAGVDLFFVISGYIMGLISVGRAPAEFLKARLRRIYPLYWICSLPVVYALWHSPSLASIAADVTLWPAWESLAFPSLPPAWSLCFEMLFYLGCTLALATNARVPLAIFAACLAINFMGGGPLFRFVGSPLALEFLGGMLLTRLPRNIAFSKLLLVAAVVVFALSPVSAIHSAEIVGREALAVMSRVLWWGAPSVALVYAASCHSALLDRSFFAPAAFVGDASYSIYLSHVIPNNLFMFWWPIQSAILLGIGIAVFLLVERRLLRPGRYTLLPLLPGAAVRDIRPRTSPIP